MSPRSLRFRLVAWYASLVSVVLLALGGLSCLALQHFLESNLRDIEVRRARQIAETLLSRPGPVDESRLAADLESLYAPAANDRFLRVTRGDGAAVYVSGRPKDESFDPAQVPPPPSGRKPESARLEKLSGGTALLIATLDHRAASGAVYAVEVGASTAPISGMLRRLLLLLAAGLPVVLVVAVGGGLFLVGRALAPVEQIARKAEQITQHNLSERLPLARTGDELERLAISLNHMIRRIEDAVLNSKRFVADASHELRTPLTVLRAELETRMADTGLDASARESLGSMLEEVERLARIVEGLFALSRLDAGEASSEWNPFDLAELAATTADQMSLLAEDKGIAVRCLAPAPVAVRGDRSRLKQVVVNLLDNAIKYTPPGGSIRLQVVRQNGHAVLDVEDSGIGIPPESIPHVFDRFYRVDAARSREEGGAGLGLSIVQAICAAHDARVEVESTLSKGSLFRVRIPAAAADEVRRKRLNEH
ncbi:MAG: ATP-binding protein [Verrucomicrobiota bacterium]